MANPENQQKHQNNHKTHRAHELLETLRRLGGSARTSHLADTMDVSEETIRRTVKKLSKEGAVSRAHGGVYLAEDQRGSDFHRRIGENPEAKRSMAGLLATLVDDDSSVFLDVGTTTVFVAEALRTKNNLTVITNSMSVAQILMGHNKNRVFLAGGELQNDVGGTFGAATQKFISKFRVDISILSAEAVDAEQGFLLGEQNEAELAQIFIAHARKNIMVADHTKINQRAPIVSCDPLDIDIFVTDEHPNSNIIKAMKNWNIQLLIAPAKKKKSK